MSQALSIKGVFNQERVKNRFNELLGRKSQGFLASILQVVLNDKHLKEADPNTVLTAAATAAILDLPINQNLGFAYIVPYKGQAQFQIGWKGLVQLAQRTGQYEVINAIPVYPNQFESFDYLSETLKGDFTKEGQGEPIGYAAFFKMHNGMKKTVYWTREKVDNHAKKYSKSYSYKTSVWQTDFNSMAIKTVLKNLISKWGLVSIEMQTAVLADQSVQNKEGEFSYPDDARVETTELAAEEEEYNNALEEWKSVIDGCNTISDFSAYLKSIEEIESTTLKAVVKTHFRAALAEKGLKLINEGKEIVSHAKN